MTCSTLCNCSYTMKCQELIPEQKMESSLVTDKIITIIKYEVCEIPLWKFSCSGNQHFSIQYKYISIIYFSEIYGIRNHFIKLLYHKSTAGDLLKGISVNQMKQQNVPVMLHVIVAISPGSNYLF